MRSNSCFICPCRVRNVERLSCARRLVILVVSGFLTLVLLLASVCPCFKFSLLALFMLGPSTFLSAARCRSFVLILCFLCSPRPCVLSPSQIADHQEYNEKGDVYSFSLIMWEMLAGTKPFLGEFI